MRRTVLFRNVVAARSATAMRHFSQNGGKSKRAAINERFLEGLKPLLKQARDGPFKRYIDLAKEASDPVKPFRTYSAFEKGANEPIKIPEGSLSLKTANGEEVKLPAEYSVMILAGYNNHALRQADLWAGSHDVRTLRLSLIDGPLQSVAWLVSGIARLSMQSREKASFVLHNDADNLGKSMGMRNKTLGYVFLVDTEGSVVFRGCGVPSEDDLSRLEKASSLIDA